MKPMTKRERFANALARRPVDFTVKDQTVPRGGGPTAHFIRGIPGIEEEGCRKRGVLHAGRPGAPMPLTPTIPTSRLPDLPPKN